jgi:hypothetical protein
MHNHHISSSSSPIMAPTRTQKRTRTQPVPATDLSDNEDIPTNTPSTRDSTAGDDINAMAISFATIDINSTYTWAQETVDYFEYSAATFELGPQHQQVLLRGMEAYARTHFSDEQVSFSRIRSHFYHHTYITISVARRGA